MTTQTKAASMATTATILALVVLGATQKVSQAATPTATPRPTSTLAPKATTRPTSTPSAAQITATARAASVKVTATAKAIVAQATAQARATSIALFAGYLPIGRQELVSYAEEHVDETVTFNARIFNIVKDDETTMQVNYAGSSDAIYVETLGSIEGVYEGTNVIIYGKVNGTKCFENTLGNQVCQPHITNAVYLTGLDSDMRVALATAQVEAGKNLRQLQAERAADVAAAKATVAAIASEYGTLPWRELVTYASKHGGEKLRVSGRIFNIVPGSSTQLQMFIAGTTEAVYVEMEDPFSGLYEDTNITVYGEVLDEGFHCFENSSGGQVCQPALVHAFYTK